MNDKDNSRGVTPISFALFMSYPGQAPSQIFLSSACVRLLASPPCAWSADLCFVLSSPLPLARGGEGEARSRST